MAEITYETIKTGFSFLKKGFDKTGMKYPKNFVKNFGKANNELVPIEECIGDMVDFLEEYELPIQCPDCDNMLPETSICLYCGYVFGECQEQPSEESQEQVEVEEQKQPSVEETQQQPPVEETQQQPLVEETQEQPLVEETQEQPPVKESVEEEVQEDVEEGTAEEPSENVVPETPAFVTTPGSKAHIIYSKIYYGATVDEIVEVLLKEYPKDSVGKLKRGIGTYVYNWNKKYGWGIKKDENGVYRVGQ